MTEIDRINKKLAKSGRLAYKKAKSEDKAFIAIGNGIYRISADGKRSKIVDLPCTRVKAKQKSFEI